MSQLLTVELANRPEALPRVLTVLRRRRCRVTSVEFVAPDRHYAGRLIVGIVAPRAHAHCVPAWLENLVEVRAVTSPRSTSPDGAHEPEREHNRQGEQQCD
jgi:acetolactate synthase regulatory subunit